MHQGSLSCHRKHTATASIPLLQATVADQCQPLWASVSQKLQRSTPFGPKPRKTHTHAAGRYLPLGSGTTLGRRAAWPSPPWGSWPWLSGAAIWHPTNKTPSKFPQPTSHTPHGSCSLSTAARTLRPTPNQTAPGHPHHVQSAVPTYGAARDMPPSQDLARWCLQWSCLAGGAHGTHTRCAGWD
jgi:hypothetical protein